MRRMLFVGVGLLAVSVLAGGCVLEDSDTPYTTRAASSSATAPTDPLDQMVIVFAGGYSRAQIKERIDTAMELYGLQPTTTNYSRAGSVLVGLGEDSGLREMDILDYMIRSYVPGVNLTFPEAAAIAVTFLAAGDG